MRIEYSLLPYSLVVVGFQHLNIVEYARLCVAAQPRFFMPKSWNSCMDSCPKLSKVVHSCRGSCRKIICNKLAINLQLVASWLQVVAYRATGAAEGRLRHDVPFISRRRADTYAPFALRFSPCRASDIAASKAVLISACKRRRIAASWTLSVCLSVSARR